MGTIRKAVNRVFWRFGGNGNKKPFPVNQEDVDSYSIIKDYVRQTEQNVFKNNEAFAKLYIYLTMKINEADKTSVYDANARRKIGNLLNRPLNLIIEDFKTSLNDSEMYELLDSAGIEIKHPALKNEAQTTTDTKKLIEAVKTPENREKLLREVWDYDTVQDCLISDVNRALLNY